MTRHTAVSLASTATAATSDMASYLNPVTNPAALPSAEDRGRLLGQLEHTVRHLVLALAYEGLTLPPETGAGTWQQLAAVETRLTESMPGWRGYQEAATTDPHPALRLARTARSATLEMISYLDPGYQVTAVPTATERRSIVEQIALTVGHISAALTHLGATPGTEPSFRQEMGVAAARLRDCVPDLQVLSQRLGDGSAPPRTDDFPERLAGKAQGALDGTPGRHQVAAPAPAAGPDFPSAPATQPATSHGRRAPGTGIASPAGRARPGRPR